MRPAQRHWASPSDPTCVDGSCLLVPRMAIQDVSVSTTRFSGSAAPFTSGSWLPRRVLDRAAIRRELPTPPRHVRWHLRLTTFDMRGPKELAATRLHGGGLRAAEHALLTPAPGGSSQLGPALRAVETAGFAGGRILIVASDLELFDPDPSAVLQNLTRSSANAVLALVFRSQPPPTLAAAHINVERIDPTTSTPTDIARHIVNVARSTLDARPQPVKTKDVLIDILDDESGSMWSGNDALCLRHEAALIAIEHLVLTGGTGYRKTGTR